MARLTLLILSALLSIAATLGVAFALAGRNRASRFAARAESPTHPRFELLMQ